MRNSSRTAATVIARGVGLATCLAAAGPLLAGCGGTSKSPGTTTTTTTPPRTAPESPPVVATAINGAHVVSTSAFGVTATLRAGTHLPKVNARWPIHFTVTSAGRPARASVTYEYLFAGQVVARRSHYVFTGNFADVFRFPASAVGYPLTFRALITSGATTIALDYPVRVRG